MIIVPFNAQVYNATPIISSASGTNTLEFGEFGTLIGMPIMARAIETNYVVRVVTNTVYITSTYENTNYIKGA